MADSNVNIRITTDGGDKLKKLVEDLEAGKLTLNEITQLKKELNATFKTLQTGSEEWNRYAAMLAKVNDFQRDVRVATKAGHEEYFKLGLEIRQLTLASGLLGGNVGKLTNTMSGAISGAIGLKQALVPLGIQFGAISMGITAAVVALPALIDLYDQLSRKVAANLAGKQGSFLDSLMGQAQGGDAPGAIERLEKRIRSLRALKDTEGLRELGIVGGDDSGFWELRRKLLFEQARAAKNAADEELRLRAALTGDYSPVIASLETKLAKETDTNKALKLQSELNATLKRQYEEQARAGNPFISEQKRGIGASAFGVPKGPMVKSKTLADMEINGPEKVFQETTQQLTTFQQLAITASGAIANSITGTIGGAWNQVFGRAKTLLGQFGNMFASQMLSLATNYGLGMLFANIGGPLGGIGVGMLKSIGVLGDGGHAMAGRPYIVGDRGPELFVPPRSGEVVSNAKASRFGAMAMGGGPIVLEARIRGNDIYLTNERAGSYYNARRRV